MVFPLIAIMNKKSASCFGALFFACLLAPIKVAAQEAATPLEIGIGVSALRFDYREFGSNGKILDRELGGIPGMSARIAQRRADWEWETAGSYHAGRVNYTGQTNYGVPLNTVTNESIGDASFRLGHSLDSAPAIMPYAGIGYHYWARDILATASASGLYEVYQWPYLWVGGKLLAFERQGARLMLDFGLLRPLHVTLDVHAPSTQIRVFPESKTGFRMSMTSDFQLASNLRMTITPYAENWELGRSPAVNGTYEPDSSTRNAGLDLKLNWTL